MTRARNRRGRLLIFVIVVVIIGASITYALQRGGGSPAQRPGALALEPSHGPIQAAVRITGDGVGTAKKVTFDGVPAPFTVDSSTEITARVPASMRPGSVTIAVDGGTATTASFEVTRPNIVFILVDDARFDDLSRMPILKKDLTDHGVNFVNGFVTNPLCAPSRSTILTGRYSHSTGVYWNGPPHGGYTTFTDKADDQSTIATWLQKAGYRTAMIGKYLNGYKQQYSSDIPPGWSEWDAFTPVYGSVDRGGYFNYWMTINGKRVFHGAEPEDYSTTVWSNYGVHFIKSTPKSQPLFLYLALRAPHVPVTPEPKYANACQGLAPLRPPSYNEADVSDKPAYIRDLPLMNAEVRSEVDLNHLDHCRTLLSVDNQIGRIVDTLKQTGRLQDTLLMFASDNGFEEGEHRWPSKKIAPYEEDLHVPMIVRYDALTQSRPSVNKDMVLNVDFAQTFAAAAGVKAPRAQGTSFLPMLAGASPPWRHHFLIEHWAPLGVPWYVPPYCGVQDGQYVFVQYGTQERELYDLSQDPYELQNIASDPADAAIVQSMQARTAKLCRPPPPSMRP